VKESLIKKIEGCKKALIWNWAYLRHVLYGLVGKNYKKIMWENTAAIYSVLKKKITKLNSQSTQY
jgi:hypothetical protein